MSIATNNLFSQDGFFWWFGVVEDRMDPLLLGRVRVRIIGYHSDDQSLLATDDLPWAIPMQSINSAAISGKGDAPLGPLEGTWVIGFFADGKDCQQPVVMGTLGGLPGDLVRCGKKAPNLNNVKRDQNGNVVRDQNGDPILEEPATTVPADTASKAIASTLPPLEQVPIQRLMDALGQRESGSVPGGTQNYAITNQLGFVGKYQFGAAALQTLGYVSWPVPAKSRKNSELSTSGNWTGKNGISSLEDWKANKNNCQEVAMYELLRSNYNSLKSMGVISTEDSPDVVSGYLATAHLLGPGGARDLKRGIINKDANGTTAYTYFELGVKAQGSTVSTPVAANSGVTAPKPPNPIDWTGPLNDPKLGNPDGFGDPNQVWPDCDYVDRQDTNKLATNNSSKEGTILEEKEKDRVEEVPVANGGESWEEPPSAYNAKYPYNKVTETESGHVIELDDTPNAERVHIYHRSGTHVEIDKNGTLRCKIKGDKYEIVNKNDNLYVQGSLNISVDGAQTLLVKNTVDVEIFGKTTVNIKDEAEVNITKDANVTVGGKANINVSDNLNIKAKNINMQAEQDINLTAGNYMNIKTVGDLNFTVAGDEQHRVFGTYDLDAILVNINSGTANPFTALSSGLGGVTVAEVIAGDLTNLPLPTDLANALNPISKTLGGLIGQIGGANSILNIGSLGGLLSGTGVQGLLNNALTNPAIANALSGLSQLGNVQGIIGGQLNGLGGLGGIGNVINTIGLGNFNQILGNAGLGNINSIVENALSNPALANAVGSFRQAANVLSGGNGLDIGKILQTGGLPQLDRLLGDSGLGNLNSLLSNAGVNLQSLSQNILTPEANQLLRNITNSGVIPQDVLQRGIDLTKAFYKNGAGNFDVSLAKLVPSVTVNGDEFKSWSYFSPKTQLSKYFDLGALTSRVAEPALQFPVMRQFGLSKSDITTNLKALSVNVLDPIADRYRNIQITDAFRPSNNYLAAIQVNNPIKDLVDAAASGDSSSAEVLRLMNSPTAHNLGQAANIQFKDMKAADYFDAARWIRDNVAYDQIRLEYSTMGDCQPFITVTHNPAGNRSNTALDKVVTCVNGQVVANYLVDMTSV